MSIVGVLLSFVLLAGIACFGQDTRSEEKNLLPLTPEFPKATAKDVASLRVAVGAFLAAPEWAVTSADLDGWDFSEIASLTRDGERVGVYGDVAFPVPVSREGPLTIMRCGSAETWQREGGSSFPLGGLHVRLMDGDVVPWQVLPLNSRGERPGFEEMRTYIIGFQPC